MINTLRQRLNIPDRETLRQRFYELVDNRVRDIAAGLSIKELRAVLRGDAPTERPNPRYKVHTSSFWVHIRPRFYLHASTWFTHTFRLGWLAMFFFTLEILTGVILMVYYIPFPDQAYESILIIESNVWFGELLRDLHRLGAEAMVIVVWLHLFRTYFTGSYKGPRSFTWLTGVVLLFVTAWLSFTGYLLTWDQLGYWAITVGSSITESGPFVGPELNILLRGAPDIGTGGLLRFYLQHIILFPLIAIILISVHYYKVAREHGISLPATVEEGDLPKEEKKDATRRVDWIPDLLTHEVFLVCFALFVTLAILAFDLFNSPLETPANPQKTPLDTKAPWYFWWLQGMLKIDPAKIIEDMVNPLLGIVGIELELSRILDSKFIMGLLIPPGLVALLAAIPYIDRNPSRLAKNRPIAIAWGLAWVFILIALSYMGLPQFGIETPAATRVIQDLAPEEGLGPLREVPFEEWLGVGSTEFVVGEAYGRDVCPAGFSYIASEGNAGAQVIGCPHLTEVFTQFAERLIVAEEEGKLPDMEARLIVEHYQHNVFRIQPTVEWTDSDGDRQEFHQVYFLHQEGRREE